MFYPLQSVFYLLHCLKEDKAITPRLLTPYKINRGVSESKYPRSLYSFYENDNNIEFKILLLLISVCYLFYALD